MRDRKVATRYAGALLISAKAEGVLESVAESYAGVMELVADNRQLISFRGIERQGRLLFCIRGDHRSGYHGSSRLEAGREAATETQKVHLPGRKDRV